jgi:hypothetical protein
VTIVTTHRKRQGSTCSCAGWMVREDEELLALSAPPFDGLYEYGKRALLLGREPS